jgi:hypothetical protein
MRGKRDVRHGCNDDAGAGVEPEGDGEQGCGRVEVEENETRQDIFNALLRAGRSLQTKDGRVRGWDWVCVCVRA